MNRNYFKSNLQKKPNPNSNFAIHVLENNRTITFNIDNGLYSLNIHIYIYLLIFLNITRIILFIIFRIFLCL